MEGVSLDRFLAVQQAAKRRTENLDAGKKLQDVIAQKQKELGNANAATQSKQTPHTNKVTVKRGIGDVLNTMGDAANRYLSSTESIEEKIRNSDKFVKKVGNFIDIRA